MRDRGTRVVVRAPKSPNNARSKRMPSVDVVTKGRKMHSVDFEASCECVSFCREKRERKMVGIEGTTKKKKKKRRDDTESDY